MWPQINDNMIEKVSNVLKSGLIIEHAAGIIPFNSFSCIITI